MVSDGLRVSRLQDEFPTRPGLSGLTYLEQGRVWVYKACQIGGVQIALGADPAGTPMPALGESLLDPCSTVTRLGQLRAPGVDLHHPAASTRSQTAEGRDKQPRCAQAYRAPVAALPGSVGEVFQMKGIAQGYDLMGELSLAALARGRELPMEFAPQDLHLALAFGHLPAFLAWFDAATFIVVVRVIGPPLPVELPLQPPKRSGIGGHHGAERLQARFLLSHHGDGGRAQIQSHDAGAELVLWLARGGALAHQLRVKAVA